MSLKPALAIDGGRPVRVTPVAPWPHFGCEELEAAARVLRSGKVNYWTGEEGRTFESEFAAYVGCDHAVALANGTVALELALLALGIGPGDEVIVPSRTFIASASCVVMRGARPVLADVDLDTQNLTVESVRACLTPRTKAILAVHLAGCPCDLEPLSALARAHGLKLIEDCAQAHGARYRDRPVGSCGDAAAFSFCQDKIMTTGGEGGMLVTNDAAVWERAWSYKDHGKNFALANQPSPRQGFRWLHETFGTNWRLTEMQSAIGRAALKKLPGWIQRRRENAHLLRDRLSALRCLRVPSEPAEVEHSYYKFYAFVRPECLAPGWTRDRMLAAISAEGIPCGSGSCSEIYLEQAFQQSGLAPALRLPNARQLGETSLMLLVHPTLTAADLEDTCLAVEKVCRAAILTGMARAESAPACVRPAASI